jgi:hypothetical protein
VTKASDNDYPSVLLTEQSSAPSNPAAGKQRAYIRTSDHAMVMVNSSGTITAVGSGGSGTVTTVKDEGSNLSTAVVSLDFVGAGVTATGTTAVTVTVPIGADLLPWTIPIDVFPAAIQTTTFDTLTADSGCVGGARKRSTGAQNSVIGWDVVLAAGTWTVALIHFQDTDRGIYTVAFDGSSVGTIDGYAGSTTRNTRSTITGISVATTAKIRVTLTMATKNGSSSSYYGEINALQFVRTA